MKTKGYFWCDRCEDNAYGETCPHGHPARWISTATAGTAPRAAPPARTLSADQVRNLFHQMHAATAVGMGGYTPTRDFTD